jgi:hypothetical protein
MGIFKKKLEMPQAMMIFSNSVISDSKKKWPDVVNCITNNGFNIENEDEGYGVWVTGLFALDALHTYQILDSRIASSIVKDVGYTFDFRIEKLKDWPPILKEMFDFFCYVYINDEKEYRKNPIPQNLPPMTTSMTIMMGIILGYKNINNTDSIPYNSPRTQKMFNEFFSIILKSIGRWDKINKEYKVNWLTY